MQKFYIPPKDQVTSEWSGGSTTQLAIFPFESDFKERTFVFRISTATTTTRFSAFTSFPGYRRLLMVLKGTLKLEHTGQYTRELHPFDADHFYGGWETKAEGQVRDFNVIYSEKEVERASLEKKELSKGEVQLLSLEKYDFAGFYILGGKAEVEGTVLKENDFLLIERSLIENVITIRPLENGAFLLVQIDLK